MTSLSDKFSAVRKAQFEAQFDFFNSFTSQAFENASRVAALNLAVSRDVVQRSLGTGFALLNSRDPRDVLTLGGRAEEQVRSLFDYGRELIGIASTLRPYAPRPQALAQAPQLAIEPVVEAAPSPAAAVEAVVEAAPVVEPAPAPAPVHAAVAAAPAEPVVVAEPEPAPEPLAVAAEPEPVPVAEPKAIVKAVGKGPARAAAPTHPATAPVAEFAAKQVVEVPKFVPNQPGSKRKK